MTATRAIRGTKLKAFLLLFALIILAGVLTGINNTLTQITDLKQSNVMCHQQEETLSTQLQVVTDYKQRLEKSLKTEMAEHQQKQQHSEQKYKDEKTRFEKQLSEASSKFDSLQQHFNILQTNYDDYKSKQESQSDKLEKTIRELREQITSLSSDKEQLKSKVFQVEAERDEIKREKTASKQDQTDTESKINHLEKRNIELQREVEQLRLHCPPDNLLDVPVLSSSAKSAQEADLRYPIVSSSTKTPVVPSSGGRVFKPPTKSTTNGERSSQGSLNGARPIIQPTIMVPSSSEALKIRIPEGVVPEPIEKQAQADTGAINSRYRAAIEPEKSHVEKVPVDSLLEVLEPPNSDLKVQNEGYDAGFGFNANEAPKAVEKQHIDKLAIVPEQDNKPADYNDLQNDVPENDEDDDDYLGAVQHKDKDPAIRN